MLIVWRICFRKVLELKLGIRRNSGPADLVGSGIHKLAILYSVLQLKRLQTATSWILLNRLLDNS